MVDVTIIDVKIRLTEDMLGTVPADKDIHATYIASKAPPEVDTSDEAEGIIKLEEKGKTVFMRDDNALYLMNYMMIGLLDGPAIQ